MAKRGASQRAPAYVVLESTASGSWTELGEFARRPGLTARAARRQAILEATGGAPRDRRIAAVPRSEWRNAQDW